MSGISSWRVERKGAVPANGDSTCGWHALSRGWRAVRSAPMADSEAELQAPLLLIAMPQILDPFFHRSVVLLVHHDAEGSLGFIINRPTAISVSEILAGMEIEWNGHGDVVAHFGGPVQPQLGTVLFCPTGGNGEDP